MALRSLVTGGGGFIGRHVVRLLLERGDYVRVLDVAPSHGLPADVEVISGSVIDGSLMKTALNGVDQIFHMAGISDLWVRRPQSFFNSNFHGTQTVLDTAARTNVQRIVYTSTAAILKSRRGRSSGVIDESTRCTLDDMAGAYCRSKFMAEEAAHEAAARGLPVVIVNPTLPTGPGDVHLTPPSRMVLGFLNGQIPAYLDCDLNLIDVRDAALGHLLAAEKGEVGERYILGCANIRLSHLLELLKRMTGLPMARLKVPYGLAFATALFGEGLARLTGRPPLAPLTGVRLARGPTLVDSSRAVSKLGLPQTPIDRFLADAVQWFEEQRLIQRPMGRAQTHRCGVA
jgi:dihydroflavonol-4-reductase